MQKNIVITGASSGIGAAIAEYFSERNCRVFNLDISAPAGINKKLTEPSLIKHLQCDITDQSAVESTINAIASAHKIDVLISNAGIHFSADIENTSLEDFERVFAINVKGAFYVSKATIVHMKKYGGVIIYIGSDQSTIAKPNSFAYNLSKHALASMTKTMALDYAANGVRAVNICAGTIDTPLYRNAIANYCTKSGANINDVHKAEAQMQPIGRIGKATDVAALAWFLASDEASFITGSSHAIDGGYTTG